MLRREAYENVMAERLCRCVDFLRGELPPFIARVEDSTAEKVWRVGVATLQVAKALPLSTRAYAAVHSLDAIRRYGRLGIASLFLKDELLSMLTAFKEWRGEAATDKSLAALATSLYYSMAEERQRRGEAPDAEAREHDGHVAVTDAELGELFEMAPLAMETVYEEALVDMQRSAANHGYRLLFGSPMSDVGRPAFAVFARAPPCAAADGEIGGGAGLASEDGPAGRAGVAVLAVRGTSDLADAIVDARAEGVPLGPTGRRRRGRRRTRPTVASVHLVTGRAAAARGLAVGGLTVESSRRRSGCSRRC